MDLVAANYGSHSLSVLLGNGDGTFGDATTYFAGQNPWSLILEDLDGDSNIDLTTGNRYADGVAVLINRYPVNVNTCAGDLDLDGDVDGSDLAKWISNQPQINLPVFTPDFGKANCYD